VIHPQVSKQEWQQAVADYTQVAFSTQPPQVGQLQTCKPAGIDA